MHVLVIGPGAIGACVAARLARAGLPVTVACRTAKTADHINASGIVSEDENGVVTTAKTHAVVAPEELLEEPGIVFLATKCGDAAAALQTWLPHVAPDVPVVSLQNGMMGDVLAPLAEGRFVDTVVHFPASLDGVGRSVRTGPGGFDVGPWPTSEGPSATASNVALAARTLALVSDTRTVANLQGAKWTKLIINSGMTSLGVVTGTTFGEMLTDRRARDAFIHIADEGFRAGAAAGVSFEAVGGFDPSRFSLGQGAAWKKPVLRFVLGLKARKYKRHVSSSLQSLRRGMKTEVDELNGVIVASGKRAGEAVPVNRAIVDVIHQIEAGKLQPSMENLDLISVERAGAGVP